MTIVLIFKSVLGSIHVFIYTVFLAWINTFSRVEYIYVSQNYKDFMPNAVKLKGSGN